MANLIRCSLPASDGGGECIVTPEYCKDVLNGTNRGSPTQLNDENWQPEMIEMLEQKLQFQHLSAATKEKYEKAIKDLRGSA